MTHPTMQRIFDKTGKTPAEIARILDTTPQNINNWSSRGISKRGALEIAKAFDFSVDWILTGEDEMAESVQAPTPILKQMRMWDFMPNGMPVHHPENGPIINVEHVICCQVLDESMSPFFYKGDYVFADRSLKPETGGYVIAKKSDGSEIVRRYKEYLDPKTGELHQELVALDEFFPPIQRASESFEILGTIFEHKRFISKGVGPLESIGLR